MQHILTDEEYKELIEKASKFDKREDKLKKEIEKKLRKYHLDYKAEYESYKEQYERVSMEKSNYYSILQRLECNVKKYNKSTFWHRLFHKIKTPDEWKI